MTFYSFDTSSFLNGQRDLFPPATFPTLWENIAAMIEAGDVRSIDLVRDELAAKDDEVPRWAKGQADLFVPLTQDVQVSVREVLAEHHKLIGVGSGRSGADPFVIALARVHAGTVVTEELLSRSLTKPKIPDVCDAMGVRRLNLMQFIQEQGWVFR